MRELEHAYCHKCGAHKYEGQLIDRKTWDAWVDGKIKRPEVTTQPGSPGITNKIPDRSNIMTQQKKYELIQDDTKQHLSKTLYRIRALIAVGPLVSAGDLGGYVESENCLSQDGDAWVYGDAWVSGDAWVYGDAAIVWFTRVGSENGTLTVCAAKEGLFVSRGCFSGSDIDFLSAVDGRHGAESKIGREYHMLIEVARSRIAIEVKE